MRLPDPMDSQKKILFFLHKPISFQWCSKTKKLRNTEGKGRTGEKIKKGKKEEERERAEGREA
jgi:predicted nucleotidyltransferase